MIKGIKLWINAIKHIREIRRRFKAVQKARYRDVYEACLHELHRYIREELS